MKVWIGICLLWFVGRMAFAAGFSQDHLHEVSSVNSVNFEAISSALIEARNAEVQRRLSDGDKTSSILKMINSYHSPEELIRGPLSREVLPIPAPSLYLGKFEMLIYTTLVQREYYPEVRVIYDIAEDMRAAVSQSGFVISHKERKEAQKACFSKSDFSRTCLIENSLREALSYEVEVSLKENQIAANAQPIINALIELLSREAQGSVFHRDNFHSDGAEFWLAKKSPQELLSLCISQGGEFEVEDLADGSRCKKIISQKLLDKENMSPFMKESVLRHVLGPFSIFKELINSFLEGPLEDKPYCFPGRYHFSCMQRKIAENLREWKPFSDFSAKEKNQLINGLAKNWD